MIDYKELVEFFQEFPYMTLPVSVLSINLFLFLLIYDYYAKEILQFDWQ